ncbi:MAG: glycosyltransferase family 4 protein [Candidatus Ratteibacteria bacterium]
MKVNILCSIDKNPSAMNRQFLEIGNYLYSKGHDIAVIKPVRMRYPRKKKDSFEIKLGEIAHFISGKRVRPIKKLPWIDIKCPVKIIPSIDERYLGKSDIIFYSHNSFVPFIIKLTGIKIMRINWIPEDSIFIPENISIVAVSTLVKKVLEERLQREVFLLVNFINTKVFNNPYPRKTIQTIGMFFYNKKPTHKGMDDGFWVMEQLHQRYPFLKFQVAGEWKERDIPSFVQFIDSKKQENLLNFYKDTDILIYTSKRDACPNPPMEAMASRCAVVTTEVGGIADYTIPDKTAIVVQPKDKEGILKGVIALLENNDYFRSVSEEGYKKIQEFSVEAQGDKLERILSDILKK